MNKEEKNVEQVEKQNNNLMIYAIIGALLLLGFLFWFNSRNSLVAGQSETLSPTPTEAYIPTDTPIPTAQVQQAPIQYKNYGWYTHDGKSMQYVNGNWYSTPQQNAASTTQPQTNNGGSPTYNAEPIVTCVLSYGTFQYYQSVCDTAKQNDTGANQNTLQSTPTPTPVPQNNNANLYNQCVSNAQYTYNQQQQQCMAEYGGGSSAGPACVQIAQQNEQQALNTCAVEYPH